MTDQIQWDQPSQPATVQSQPHDGVVWDDQSSQSAAPQPAAQSQPLAPQQGFSISAPEQPKSFMGKFAKWIDNVEYDLKNGTDMTGVGTVMQKLGAHGLSNGNNEHVADFMASLPLGLMKAAKGASELTPSVVGGEKGRTWQGVKDLVGGGLQAVSMPAAFVAPEESAISDEGLLSDAANVASKAAAPVKNAASAAKSVFTNIPKETDSTLAKAVGDAAEGAGFERGDAGTFKEAVADLAQKFQDRAKSVYQRLDEEAPGFQELKDKIQQYKSAYKNQLNNDPEKADMIAGDLKQAQSTMDDLLDDGQRALWKTADQDWSRFKALQQVQGKAANAARDLTSDELTNVDKLHSGVAALGNKMKGGNPVDIFARAFGDDAENIRGIVQEATKATSQSQIAKTVLQWLGGAAGATVLGGAGYKVAKMIGGN